MGYNLAKTLMKKSIFTLLLVMLAMTSFAQKNVHNITQAQARIIESEFGVLTAPIIGELGEISPNKIIDSVEFYIGNFKDAAREIVPYLDDYKRYTIAHYCTKSGFDLIINPLFQVSTNADGDKLKVIVTGFPAKYKKFRSATKDDSWMLPFLVGDNKSDKRIENVMR